MHSPQTRDGRRSATTTGRRSPQTGSGAPTHSNKMGAPQPAIAPELRAPIPTARSGGPISLASSYSGRDNTLRHLGQPRRRAASATECGSHSCHLSPASSSLRTRTAHPRGDAERGHRRRHARRATAHPGREPRCGDRPWCARCRSSAGATPTDRSGRSPQASQQCADRPSQSRRLEACNRACGARPRPTTNSDRAGCSSISGLETRPLPRAAFPGCAERA